MQLARWSALAFLSILLIACSGSSKVRKPADLVNVTNQVELVEVWSASVGNSVPANFRPLVAGDHVFAASARGTLSKLNIQNGRAVWEVSVPEKLSIGPGSDGKTTVVISTEGNVYGYDEAGKNIWMTPIASEVLSDPIVAAGVVVIRTLDPPLHEFLPKREDVMVDLARLPHITPKEKKELTAEEKEFKSKRKQIQEKLIKFATRIPAFMYLTDFRENTLTDVITKLEPDLFLTVTGLTVKDFHLLVQLRVFNTEHMNQAVFAFRRYEDASLRYTGIDSHEGLSRYGLFNTVVAIEKE